MPFTGTPVWISLAAARPVSSNEINIADRIRRRGGLRLADILNGLEVRLGRVCCGASELCGEIGQKVHHPLMALGSLSSGSRGVHGLGKFQQLGKEMINGLASVVQWTA